MNTISKIPVKRYRRIALPSEFRIRKKTLRVIRYLFSIVFSCFVMLVSINLMKTYFPKHHRDEHRAMMLQKEHHKLHLSKTKIDWHDYDLIKEEKQRTGLGEQGIAADSSSIKKELLDKLYEENGYNGALSDIISLQRSLPDIRPPNCSKILYTKNLPDASVVIPFHNEHFSVLMRTVWSITNRSPENLIKDIILVDDYSTKDSLKDELDEYIERNFPKVKILRLKSRSGLIIARQEGAKLAEGKVLIFLDAHCEANVNWLPPLLDIISDDYKTCVCPFIDIINADTYKYITDMGGRGGFNWDLTYKRLFKFKRYSEFSTEPFESPVMAGGLFAISAKFFWELGGYDDGLFIWGGEQFEISFKIWQCGGRMLDVPCSRVGHVYRKYWVFKRPENYTADYLCMNYRRVAEVWMDEYKEHYYKRHPDCAVQEYGDISKQLAIRKKLNCKPFKWYMEEVAYDVTNRYPYIDPADLADGQIRNAKNPDYCVETTSDAVTINRCSDDSRTQKLQFTWRGEIKQKFSKFCWDAYPSNEGKSKIAAFECHFTAGNQYWMYDMDTKTIIKGFSNYCLDMQTAPEVQLFLSHCDNSSKSQQWNLENFDQSILPRIQEFPKNLIIDGK